MKKEIEVEMIKLQNSQYKFSTQHKAKSIILDKNNSKAINPIPSWISNELVLVEGTVFRKGSCIRFKI